MRTHHAHMHVYVYNSMHVYIHILTQRCVYVCMYVCFRECMRTRHAHQIFCADVDVHASTCKYLDKTHTYIHLHTH
jgi:hypothetical protein